MRLIDADALIERVYNDIEAIEDKEPEMAMGAIGVLNMIKKAPTELEIVLCKDCKWAEKAVLDKYCVECAIYHTSCARHGYCHHGERKEEKQVTGKLDNVEDSTVTEDSEACNEQKSKLESDISVGDMGEVSDGYHTFNQLYHQRAVLFATIVNQNKDKAWKSWKHEDDKFCFDKEREWFIVGVDTPEGSYTYHYEKKYWDLFDCEELDKGKHWDGHTEDDVTRLLLLPPVEPPKKVVAQIRFDADEIVERIKEEYEIKDLPVCEDAISRQDTVNALCQKCGLEHKCGGADCNEDWCPDVKVVMDMPPVEPDRPKGEWIVYPLMDEGRVELECPICGDTFVRAIDYRPNFCENCGADMR